MSNASYIKTVCGTFLEWEGKDWKVHVFIFYFSLLFAEIKDLLVWRPTQLFKQSLDRNSAHPQRICSISMACAADTAP